MENNTKLIVAVIATALICIAGTYVAVGGSDNENSDSYVTVTGSTTVQPLMVAIQEEFEKYSNFDIHVTGGGSGAGVTAAQNGTADIGMLSRDLKPTETGLTPTNIAMDAVVVLVHKDAGVTNLTLEQIAKIYSGEYTNWNQVGGANLKINPIIREDGSGTRECLDTKMATIPGFKTDNFNKYSTQSSTGAMLTQVKSVSGSIGYVNLGVLESIDTSAMTAVSVDNIKASAENVTNGTYEISRNLVLVTKGTPSGSAASLINWILSPQGQAIVQAQGFVPLSAAS